MEDDAEYDIAVTQLHGDTPHLDTSLAAAVEATLRRHGTATARIGIAVVDDDRIAELNRRHLNHSGPTDVLSFDLRDQQNFSTNSAPDVEGELVVSFDTADREARSRGHAVEAELALYAVHGTLHLLGYDDASTEQAARMHGVEDEILASIGLPPVYRSEA